MGADDGISGADPSLILLISRIGSSAMITVTKGKEILVSRPLINQKW